MRFLVTEEKKLTCKSCGTQEEVQECIDPYLADVCNKEIIVNLCPKCYRESIMDI